MSLFLLEQLKLRLCFQPYLLRSRRPVASALDGAHLFPSHETALPNWRHPHSKAVFAALCHLALPFTDAAKHGSTHSLSGCVVGAPCGCGPCAVASHWPLRLRAATGERARVGAARLRVGAPLGC
eukprot:6178785-Pleurochrysis_carterae.AAC.4